MALFTAIGAAIGGLISSFTAGSFFASTFGKFLVKTLARAATSFLVSAIQGNRKPAFQLQGQLQSGEDVSRGVPLGVAATPGSLVYGNEWGKAGKTPNAYLTQVIALADMPIKGLLRVRVNGAWVTLLTPADAAKGKPVQEFRVDGTDFMWVKFYDGTQTVADSFLTGTVSSADRPYLSTRVGTGVAYVIVTFRLNEKLFTSFPQFLFEVDGVKLYDASKDTTVGGTGPQRWATPSTWGGDGDYLPVVQAYNVLRGMSFGGKWQYGFQGVTGGRLPLAGTIAAIEVCRQLVAISASTFEPRFRSGGYLNFDVENGSSIEGIMSACAGRISDNGGIFEISAASVPAASASITDAMLMSADDSAFEMVKGLAETINAITAQYPDPAEGYNLKDAPAIYRLDLEAVDSNRRLPATMTFSNVPYPLQVQRLMALVIEEARRARRHTIHLPPDFWALNPNDIVEWTSARHGYTSKEFRINAVIDQPDASIICDIIEIDPADYDFNYNSYTPLTNSGPSILQIGTHFAQSPTLTNSPKRDALGVDRGPGLRFSWDGAEQDGVLAMEYELRVTATGVLVKSGQTTNVAAGELFVYDGVLQSISYTGLLRPVSTGGPVGWSGPLVATTGATAPVQGGDIGPGAVAYGNLIAPQTGVGLNADRFCRDATAWKAIVGAFSIVPDTTASGGSSLQSSTIAGQFLSQRFAIDRLRNHVAHITIRRTAGASSTYLMVAFQDASGANITTVETGGLIGWPSASTYFYFGLIEQVPLAINTTYSIAFGPDEVAKIPPTAAFAQIGFFSNYTGGAGTQAISDADIYEKAGAAQIGSAAIQNIHLGASILEAQNFAAGVKPVEIFSALPATGNSLGRQVILTSEPRRLYTHTGSPTDATGFTSELLGEDLRPGSVTTGKLAAASVTTTILAAGAVTADKVLITGRGGALNDDPNFTDASAWNYNDTPNIVTITDGVSGNKAMRGLANTNHQYHSDFFPISDAKKYSLLAFYRKSSDANGALYLRMGFYDGSGAFLNYKENYIPTLSTSWASLTDTNITPPAGAVSAIVFFNPNNTGTVGYHEVQGFGCYEMNGSALTVIGGIKADQIDVTNLSAISGDVGTLTAGVLQSPNYVALTSGSMIDLDAGFAEFNELVVRESMILLGAVSRNFGIRKDTSPVAVASPTIPTILGNILSFPAGTFSQLVNDQGVPLTLGNYAANPILMTGLVTVFGTTGTKARLELDLQYTINGSSWFGLLPGFDVTLIAAQANDGAQVAFTIVCEGTTGGAGSSSAALWTGLRLGAKTYNFTPFTGASINVGRIQSSIQQVNK